MQEVAINYIAVIVATLAKMVVGALWYSPLLFINRWMALTGVTQQQMTSILPRGLASDLVGSFLMAWVLAHAIGYAAARGVLQGAAVGFFNWLGFVAFTTLSQIIYERRPLGIYPINVGYLLVSLLIMGGILGGWS